MDRLVGMAEHAAGKTGSFGGISIDMGMAEFCSERSMS